MYFFLPVCCYQTVSSLECSSCKTVGFQKKNCSPAGTGFVGLVASPSYSFCRVTHLKKGLPKVSLLRTAVVSSRSNNLKDTLNCSFVSILLAWCRIQHGSGILGCHLVRPWGISRAHLFGRLSWFYSPGTLYRVEVLMLKYCHLQWNMYRLKSVDPHNAGTCADQSMRSY